MLDPFGATIMSSHIPQWQRKFILWPRRCSISNRLMWLEDAYYGWYYVLVDIGRHKVKLSCWHNEKDHILYLLTNQE